MVAVGLPLVPILGVLGLAIGGVACAVVRPAILARAVDGRLMSTLFANPKPVLAWMIAAGVAWGCSQGPALW